MSNATPQARRARCAIYTRKSSEEGLEQAFNSLDAQREACEAYIRSQRHEGWSVIPTLYDDGGFSGGTMDRPALQALLGDIQAGKVDVVVVYKIDRLTRSLYDFAKIVEIFDAQKTSFVSVTQAFNTTTSMGRLTLNVLLSFAQFEREITGERIRDKFAASKKKGMWMGGNVPLGYDVRDRRLVINESEAQTVHTIFGLYARLGSVTKVKEEADRLRLRTKARISTQRQPGGALPFRTGHLYTILRNPLYVGQVQQKGQTYPGDHPGIVDPVVWDRTQAHLASNAAARRTGASAKEPSLLAGLLFDRDGNRMTPTHAVKGGKRYRYYVSHTLIAGHDIGRNGNRDGTRIPAQEIEQHVADAVLSLLSDGSRLLAAVGVEDRSPMAIRHAVEGARALVVGFTEGSPSERRELIQNIAERVVLEDDLIRIDINRFGLRSVLAIPEHQESARQDEAPLVVSVPVELRRLGKEIRLIVTSGNQQAKQDPALIKAIVRAHAWLALLRNREVESIADIARSENLQRTYVSSLMPFAFLAPDITEAILDGCQPLELSLDRVLASSPLPTSWTKQRTLLGFTKR
ncbi:MAG TPA: recombinase family protein [Stellaceae bacterium]|nr:recombinase family protein [Stellaceae bacterium]